LHPVKLINTRSLSIGMGITRKVRGKLSRRRRRKTEHEVMDLRTGERLKLVKEKQSDGSFRLSRVGEASSEPKEEKMGDIELREAEETEIKAEAKSRKDLLDILEDDITRAIEIKEERDELKSKLTELEKRVEDIEEHKTARRDAEEKATTLEDQVVSLRDEKAELEEAVARLKEERREVEEKIEKYEKVLLSIKEKVLNFNRKIS